MSEIANPAQATAAALQARKPKQMDKLARDLLFWEPIEQVGALALELGRGLVQRGSYRKAANLFAEISDYALARNCPRVHKGALRGATHLFNVSAAKNDSAGIEAGAVVLDLSSPHSRRLRQPVMKGMLALASQTVLRGDIESAATGAYIVLNNVSPTSTTGQQATFLLGFAADAARSEHKYGLAVHTAIALAENTTQKETREQAAQILLSTAYSAVAKDGDYDLAAGACENALVIGHASPAIQAEGISNLQTFAQQALKGRKYASARAIFQTIATNAGKNKEAGEAARISIKALGKRGMSKPREATGGHVMS